MGSIDCELPAEAPRPRALLSAACVFPSQRVLEPSAALACAALVLQHVGINATRLAPQPRARATGPRAARGNVGSRPLADVRRPRRALVLCM